MAAIKYLSLQNSMKYYHPIEVGFLLTFLTCPNAPKVRTSEYICENDLLDKKEGVLLLAGNLI